MAVYTAARRMPYDRDGSVGFVYNVDAGTVTEFSNDDLKTLNDESDGYVEVPIATRVFIGLAFPQLRDISAYRFYSASNYGTWPTPQMMQVSANTTNGIDGTWTTVANPFVYDHTNAWRSPHPISGISAVKAVRFRTNNVGVVLSALHLYGSPHVGQTPNRLVLWKATTDAALQEGDLDFGSVPRTTHPVRAFRVKNNAAALKAVSPVLTAEALTDGYPAVADMLEFNKGGGYAPSITLATLAPHAISGIIEVRLRAASNAPTGTWAQRIIAAASAWTAV